jgi:hypothetical protein
VGGKALAHQRANRLRFSVQATGLESLDSGGVGFDG